MYEYIRKENENNSNKSNKNIHKNSNNKNEPINDIINEEAITRQNDSLAQYLKNCIVQEDQILIVRNLIKKKNPELAGKLKWKTALVLIQDSNIGVRRTIAYALRFNPDLENSAFLLINSLKKEKDWIVKEELVNSLGEIGLKFEKGNQVREEIELSIISSLSDKRHVVRLAAIKAVLKLKIKEAKSELEQISILDPMLKLREKASLVLEEILKQ